MRIPVDIIGGESTGRSIADRQECINFFPVVDTSGGKSQKRLMWTPGAELFSDFQTFNRVRGLHVMAGVLYAVCGGTVYRVLEFGTLETVGAVANLTGPVTMADNGTVLGVCDGLNLYVLQDGGFTIVTAASSVTYQDQVFIVSMPDSGEIRHSSLIGPGITFDPLTSGAAEGDPDNITRVLSDHRELWAFGTSSVEVFYNSGDADFLFMRLPGGFLECGCGAPMSPAKADNTVFWLDAHAMVRKADGYTPVIVSTPVITQQIKALSTWSDAEGFTMSIDGHVFYVLTFPTGNITLVYNASTGAWHRWSSGLSGGRHIGVCCAFCYDRHFIGDGSTGKIYALSMESHTDNGATIRRARTSQPIINQSGREMVYHSFELSCSPGVGLLSGQGSNPLVRLQWSDDDGKTWSHEKYGNVGAIGQWGLKVVWRRLGKARSRIYRLIITDPVAFEILGAWVDVEETKR